MLTVSDGGRPHVVHGAVRWEGDTLVADVGERSAANAGARPSVSLLFPVRSDADYSLIVDGDAKLLSDEDGRRLRIAPTKAVLHRAARSPDPSSGCGTDCVPLLSPTPGRRTAPEI